MITSVYRVLILSCFVLESSTPTPRLILFTLFWYLFRRPKCCDFDKISEPLLAVADPDPGPVPRHPYIPSSAADTLTTPPPPSDVSPTPVQVPGQPCLPPPEHPPESLVLPPTASVVPVHPVPQPEVPVAVSDPDESDTEPQSPSPRIVQAPPPSA